MNIDEGALQAAARHLCDLRGIDPNEMVMLSPPVGPSGLTCDIHRESRYIEVAMDEIKALLEHQSALNVYREVWAENKMQER